MEFNVAKCHVMHVGRTNPGHNYTMNGTALGNTDEERDIGVIVSSSLKPSKQCKKSAQVASTVLGQILRAFHYRDRHIFLSLYVQYVRPHLEFAVAAWAPWTKEDIECLERVQRRAVRAMSGLKGQTYEEKLQELKLSSLAERRKEIDMTEVFRRLSDQDSDSEPILERATGRRATRAASGKDALLKKRSFHEFRSNFFSSRVVDSWNNLPDSVKGATNVSSFKCLYRRHLESTVAPAREG